MVEMVFDVILDVFEVYISDVVSISNFGPKLGNLVKLLILLAHKHLMKMQVKIMHSLQQLWKLLFCLFQILFVYFDYLLAFLQLLSHHSHTLPYILFDF